MIKAITLLSVATTLLLTSCTSKFGSREEAQIASNNYLTDYKKVVVIIKPSDELIWKSTKDKQNDLSRVCSGKRDVMLMKEPIKPERFYTRNQRDDYNRALRRYSQSAGAKAFYDENCWFVPSLELTKEERDNLTTAELKITKTCKEEKTTNQFVCKEWRTNKTTMNKEEWDNIKPNYSYFRY